MDQSDAQKILDDLKKESEKTAEFLKLVDKKTAEIDEGYAKFMIQDDIDAIKTYKKILEENKSE